MRLTYAYRCDDCFAETERQQRITDPPLTVCPLCHQPALRRLISGGSGVIFQGGGWARDLYVRPTTGRAGDEGL